MFINNRKRKLWSKQIKLTFDVPKILHFMVNRAAIFQEFENLGLSGFSGRYVTVIRSFEFSVVMTRMFTILCRDRFEKYETGISPEYATEPSSPRFEKEWFQTWKRTESKRESPFLHLLCYVFSEVLDSFYALCFRFLLCLTPEGESILDTCL